MTNDSLLYDAPFDPSQRNNSLTLTFELTRAQTTQDAQVLDIGCGAGGMSAALRAEGRRVTGVEPHAPAAERARGKLEEVHHGTADDFFDRHADRRFAAILFADVLEHIADPGAVLARATAALTPDGVIVASVPNIAHASVRAMLIDGRWDLSDRGILDRTHLRFFHRRALVDLFSAQSLAITDLAATTLDIDTANALYAMQLSARARAWAIASAADEEADVFQYVLSARAAASKAAATQHNEEWANGTRPAQRFQPPPRRSTAVRLARAARARLRGRP